MWYLQSKWPAAWHHRRGESPRPSLCFFLVSLVSLGSFSPFERTVLQKWRHLRSGTVFPFRIAGSLIPCQISLFCRDARMPARHYLSSFLLHPVTCAGSLLVVRHRRCYFLKRSHIKQRRTLCRKANGTNLASYFSSCDQVGTATAVAFAASIACEYGLMDVPFLVEARKLLQLPPQLCC